MKKQESSLKLLANFLPPDTFGMVAVFFKEHTIHLTLTHERKTVLGDYRNPTRDIPQHRISVNINLNPYSFLITLLHELAHMLTFVHFQNTVAPHGKEWKTQFRHTLIPFIGKKIFPQDVERALIAYIQNPAASTCSDQRLYKALYRYDEAKPNHKLVDEIEVGQWFEYEELIFEKVEQLKTRCKCRCISNSKMYFFQGIVEVKQVRRDRRLIA